MIKFNLKNNFEKEIEVECWEIYETIEEIPPRHPGQRVDGKEGNYFLRPKRMMVIPKNKEGITRTYKTCCDGSRMTAKEILDEVDIDWKPFEDIEPDPEPEYEDEV